MAINRSGVYEATDQASLGWVESQAARIERKVQQEALKPLKWPELVPVYRDMSPYEDYLVTYIGRPGTGRMTPLATGAEDLPGVDVEYDRMDRQIYSEGLSYAFTDQEIGRARKLGINLRGDKVKAAYRTAGEEIERIVLTGNADYNWFGLLNYPTSTGSHGLTPCRRIDEQASGGTGNWTTGDTTAPFETIRKAFNAVWADSDMIEVPDTLLVPAKALTFLSQMIKTSAGVTSVSLWDFIEQNNPYTKIYKRPLMIKPVNELDTAGPEISGVGQPRMVLYSSNEDNLRLIYPQSLTFLAPQRVGFSQKFYGWHTTGGVQFLRPRSMCMIDGFGGNL